MVVFIIAERVARQIFMYNPDPRLHHASPQPARAIIEAQIAILPRRCIVGDWRWLPSTPLSDFSPGSVLVRIARCQRRLPWTSDGELSRTEGGRLVGHARPQRHGSTRCGNMLGAEGDFFIPSEPISRSLAVQHMSFGGSEVERRATWYYLLEYTSSYCMS